jgi:hypothetical protein
MSSSGPVAALFASPPDGGRAPSSASVEGVHLFAITACATGTTSCRITEGPASVSADYFVARGSQRGTTRTRDQTVADLYTELRDRTNAGQRLDAEPHKVGDAALGGAPEAPAKGSEADPLVKCAQDLLAVADTAGEVVLDVARGPMSRDCKVSLGAATGDGGAGRCLVQGPERAHAPGMNLR